ncbi:helix-turn-helix domain-containing protein [Strepomyces sp. STD 3.1]|nr:helix-turn-helix domain-containing protein [Streptomyces sp. STD 3.1]
MADKLNTCRTVISRWETGFRVPDRRSLVKLAGLMQCTVDDLLEPVRRQPPGGVTE